MTYKAHVKNGAIVLDEPADLPEGSRVRVEVDLPQEAADRQPIPTLYEQFKDIIGICDGLPEDLAENHDHYLHGRPKR